LIGEVLLVVSVALQEIVWAGVATQSELRDFDHPGRIQAKSDPSLFLDLGV
jgi:hypothetical protein